MCAYIYISHFTIYDKVILYKEDKFLLEFVYVKKYLNTKIPNLRFKICILV